MDLCHCAARRCPRWIKQRPEVPLTEVLLVQTSGFAHFSSLVVPKTRETQMSLRQKTTPKTWLSGHLVREVDSWKSVEFQVNFWEWKEKGEVEPQSWKGKKGLRKELTLEIGVFFYLKAL